jgi:hypothetical protein
MDRATANRATANREILRKVKLSLRRTHCALDEDLLDDIDACLQDLKDCGIDHLYAEEWNPLIISAVKNYCKANNTDDVAKSAEYMARYEKQKAFFMTCYGYGREHENERYF